jgi:hypothetical protein
LAHADGAVGAGVGAVTPVVAHDKVLPVIQPKLRKSGQRIGFRSRLEIGFGQFAVVDLDPAALDANRFPGQADDSFDGLPVQTVDDHDDVAALKVAHAGAHHVLATGTQVRGHAGALHNDHSHAVLAHAETDQAGPQDEQE